MEWWVNRLHVDVDVDFNDLVDVVGAGVPRWMQFTEKASRLPDEGLVQQEGGREERPVSD